MWMKEGAGARMGVRTSTPARTPNDLEPMADAKGEVPVVCLVLGVSAGHGALAAPMADFVVMTKRAALFTGGPDLVRAATGAEVTAEELGGWKVCVEIAGTVHNVAEDDEEAIDLARAYLDFFPSSRHVPCSVAVPAPTRACGRRRELLDIIPPNSRRPYDVRDVIDALVDEQRLLRGAAALRASDQYRVGPISAAGRSGSSRTTRRSARARWIRRRRSRRPI